MTIRVKIVPNMEPNADGEFIELDVFGLPRRFVDVEQHLEELIPIGFHMTGYSVVR